MLGLATEFKIDDIDKMILRHLQSDGRLPYSKLSGVIGLSEAATRQRVKRLIDREVMQIVAVTDPAKMGYGYQAMLGVNVSADPRGVADLICDLASAEYVVITAGRFDVIVEVVCRNAEEMLEIIGRDIRSIDGVAEVEIMTYLKLVKQTYDWGTV